MGSIYRKGRDGYFYYQAYVYNPSTGKRDKKIFHALGTKNEEIANKKKASLDKKYSSGYKIFNSRFYKNKSIYITIVSFITSGIIFYFTYKKFLQIESVKTVQKTYFEQENTKSDEITMPQIIPVDETENDSFNLASESQGQINSLEEKKIIELKIPEYDIVRVESISGAFEQGKVYVLVKKYKDIKELELLCEKIRIETKQFSNLIICLYENNDLGKALATGEISVINNEEYGKAWLAMYSYNPVEGVYFDKNPSDFLRLK